MNISTEIIAQITGLFAMGFNLFSYQQKTRKGAIICQLFGTILFTVNFFMLGAFVGALMNFIGALRAVIFINKDKLKADHIVWFIGFTAVYLASYVLTFTVLDKEPSVMNFILEFLPVIGMIATTHSYRLTDSKAIRKFGLISSPVWLIYNIANFSVGAIICEILSLASIIIGIVRLDRKKQ
ncbi:MAG: YgjV family protein [Clostridia bacterium]|nr:YgjV family protein [Clostridia bacterium]